MDNARLLARPYGRRAFLKQSAGVGASSVLVGGLPSLLAACGGGSSTTNLAVLSPTPPDPAPPGIADFGKTELAKWETDHKVKLTLEHAPWIQLHDKQATNFASGTHIHDVVYNCGWVPEFRKYLVPYVDKIPKELRDDLPPSSFKTATWDGKEYGVVFTLSLVTLYYNTQHLQQAGLDGPPKTWDDLRGYAKELTRDGRYGWVMPYGWVPGIGGVASFWMIYLQQAGGQMYGADGMPVFNDTPGVDALQLMLDIHKYSDPGTISYADINEATNVLTSGKASMMMNWPFTWVAVQDPKTSKVAGQVETSILPAGPAGTASIDGTDVWTIPSTSVDPELARQLIEFYLSPAIQKEQVLKTGWLPIRKSVLADPDVQKVATNAKVILEQAQAPYDSFVTPDYNEVTTAISTEIQKALQGQQTAAAAIKAASETVTGIIKKRS